MEEILASIRRSIADEDTGKAKPAAAAPAPAPPKPIPVPPPAAAKPAPVPPPPAPPKPPEVANNQADIDAMLASVDVAPVAKAPPPPAPPPKPVAPPVADVLDLTEVMAAAPPPPPVQSFRTIDAASDVVFADNAPEPVAASPRAPAPPAPPVFDRGLISNATQTAVDQAFSSLANTVLGNNARTLEDLVKEMLRPMLKSWLDDNLPGLVERIVRAEIERVSRGGR